MVGRSAPRVAIPGAGVAKKLALKQSFIGIDRST